MSTKSTIAHGDGFHFYHEAFENDGTVYLELNSCAHCGNEQIVRIPAHVWGVICGLAPIQLSLVDKTDEELLAIIKKDVAERIKEYQEKPSPLLAIFGSLTYGPATDPEETQIEKGLQYFKAMRANQQMIKLQMDQAQISSFYSNDKDHD